MRMVKNNTVDMSQINFSVADEIVHYLNNPREK